MLKLLAGAGKAVWTGLGLSAAVTAINVVANPKDGWVANTASRIYMAMANAQTEAGVDTSFQGFYKFIEKIAELIESFTGEGSMAGMTNWARQGMGETVDANTPGGAAADAGDVIAGAEPDLGDAFSLAAAGTAFALGSRSIPVLGGIVAGVDTLWDTGGYLIKGEFERAGTRFVGGAAETLGATGGFLTYAFGAAAREGIENTAAYAFGEEYRVPDGELAALTKTVVGWVPN